MSEDNRVIEKVELQTLPVIRDRISFLYTEHCIINKQDNAISFADERGTVNFPAAALSVLLLGPGTSLSHRAIELIADSGTSIIWVGEHGVRYYAHGRPLTHSSQLLIKQAELVSNNRLRADVVRRMYEMRFPDEDVADKTIQQLRGREGSRIRRVYKVASQKTGVEWNGREYDPNDFNKSNVVNKALSAAHACLYGICHAVIVALGLSPGLGFVHTGHERSFVYDIADLYKSEMTIPIAFEVAKECEVSDDIGSITRRRVRDAMANGKILQRAVRDIHELLKINTSDIPDTEIIHLWDNKQGLVKSGHDWSDTDQSYTGYGSIEDKEEGEEEL
jgi:CRISPR-associated protein Cas1